MVLENGKITWPVEEFTEAAIAELTSDKCGVQTIRLKTFKETFTKIKKEMGNRKVHIEAATDTALMSVESARKSLANGTMTDHKKKRLMTDTDDFGSALMDEQKNINTSFKIGIFR